MADTYHANEVAEEFASELEALVDKYRAKYPECTIKGIFLHRREKKYTNHTGPAQPEAFVVDIFVHQRGRVQSGTCRKEKLAK